MLEDIIDTFMSWWNRHDVQPLTIRNDEYLIFADGDSAEIEVTRMGGGRERQELVIEADNIEVIDRDTIQAEDP